MKPEIVAEIEGEYGPLTVSEHLVQKIWARGEFRQNNLVTLEGRSLEIRDLGSWNLLDGPDFKNVSLLVDGQPVHGDAELHFLESDWEAHGHEADPAFGNVVLHILVFPPKPRRQPVKCFVEHSLLFLDLLPQGLEAFAEEEVLGALSTGDESGLEEALLSLPFEARKAKLMDAARLRWSGKVNFARKRLELLGWEEACHQTALEILGYRYNRAVMLFLAGDYTLKALRSGEYSAETLFETGKGRWKLRGSRPANHPKQRLMQYMNWVDARPDWPAQLETWGTAAKRGVQSSSSEPNRKSLKIAELKKKLLADVLHGTVGGTRIENLVCDGFLPLLSVQTGDEYFPLWFHWFPGDVPSVLKQLFSRLGDGASRLGPSSNGAYQGLIRCLLEK